jgi:hypothetical protein
LLRGVRFEDVVIEEAIRLDFSQPAATLVESASGDSLYSLLERPEGNVLVLHVNLAKEKGDFTLRPDFARLIGNAIRWLGPRWNPYGMSATTGAAEAIPEADSPRRLTAPDGTQHTLSPQQTIVALDHVGLWSVSAGQGEVEGSAEYVMPANLVDRSESNLRIGNELSAGGIEVGTTSSWWPMWMLLVGVAFLLIVVEWCLYQRRVLV